MMRKGYYFGVFSDYGGYKVIRETDCVFDCQYIFRKAVPVWGCHKADRRAAENH